ncbi:MAG: carboxymuconolactone decarboxylase family protein [Caldilineaceae bacterium]|nr:carboxymuconolactone decarboxylase family protein [Caldilineaceae bacterium]
MPWIQQIPVADATGLLKEEFDAAMARAGRVWNIVHIMSLNPNVMRASMNMYKALLHDDSPLSRVQREMLATVVSAELACPY